MNKEYSTGEIVFICFIVLLTTVFGAFACYEISECMNEYYESEKLVKVEAVVTDVRISRSTRMPDRYCPSLRYQYNNASYFLGTNEAECTLLRFKRGSHVPVYIHSEAPNKAYLSPRSGPFHFSTFVFLTAFGLGIALLIYVVKEHKEKIFTFPPKLPFLIFGILMFLLACCFWGDAIVTYSQRSELSKECTADVKALVYASEEHFFHKANYPKVKYEFNGKKYKNDQLELCIDYCKPGHDLAIKVNPNHPQTAMITYRNPWEIAEVFFGFAAVIWGILVMLIAPTWNICNTESNKRVH